MKDIHESLVEISKIGFLADNVSIISGLPPHAEISFSDIGETGKETQILEKNKSKKKLYKILKMLIDTRKINVAHYKIQGVKIDFSWPPVVTLDAKVDL